MKIVCSIGILASGLLAAEPLVLDWGAILGTLHVDPQLQASNERISLLKKSPGIGMWDELEARYEMDGLDGREHKFELRVTPYSWGERRAAKQIGKARIQKTEAERDIALSEALYERYRLAIEWIFRDRQLHHHQALLKVFEDRIQVHGSLSGTDRFDPRDMVESQEMVVVLHGHILADENDRYEIEQELKEMIPGWTEIRLDTTGLLTSHQLRERLSKFPTMVDSTFPEFRVALRELKKVEQESELEKTAQSKVLSYAKVGYAIQFPAAGDRDKTTAIEDASIGFGIRIPFGDGRKQDVFDTEVDIADQKGEIAKLRWELSKELNEMNREIGSLVRQMSVRDSFVAKVDAGSLFTDYALRAGSDPLLLLKARSTALQAAWDAEKLCFEAYMLYLEMLKMTGALSSDPGKNHFMAEKTP